MTTSEFRDKVVLVTGASRGIGRAIALEFARRGARVAVHYHRDRAAAEDTVAALAGAAHDIFQADVADGASARDLIGNVAGAMSRIDVLVNNAGVYHAHPVTETGYDEWQEIWRATLATNLFGPANLIHAVVPTMIASGGGRVVNVSSRGAFRGEPDAPAYGASKAGLNAMGQSLARALARHRIYIATVAPGFVETDMARPSMAAWSQQDILRDFPVGRVALPEEVAITVVFLASPGTEYLTGCIVDINGASYLRT